MSKLRYALLKGPQPTGVGHITRVVTAVLVASHMSSAGPSPRPPRAAGHLLEAAHEYGKHASLSGDLLAVEAYLRGGYRNRALISLERAHRRSPGNRIVVAWQDFLRGRPGPLPDLQLAQLSPEEALLAGLLCRFLGSAATEIDLLRRASESGTSRALAMSELARSLHAAGRRKEAREVLAKAGEHSERAMVETELELAAGRLHRAAALCNKADLLRGQDPRWEKLRRACGIRSSEAKQLERFVNRFRRQLAQAYWEFDPEPPQDGGPPADEFMALEWGRFIETWDAKAAALAAEHEKTAVVVDLLRVRSRFACEVTQHGDGTFAGGRFVRYARKGLGQLLASLTATTPLVTLERVDARNLMRMFANLETGLSLDSLMSSLRRTALNPESMVAAEFEYSHALRTRGDAAGARKRLRSLRPLVVRKNSTVLFGLFAKKGPVGLAEFDRELYWAELATDQPKLPIEGVRLLDGKRLPIPRRGTKLWLIEFSEEGCAFCDDSVQQLARLHKTYAARGLGVVTIKAGASSQRAKKWGADLGLSWPLAVARDQRRSLFKFLRFDGFPSYCVADETGQILAIREGLVGLDTLKGMIRARLDRNAK